MDNPASHFDVKIQGRSLISRKTGGEKGSCAQVTGEAPVVEWSGVNGYLVWGP